MDLYPGAPTMTVASTEIYTVVTLGRVQPYASLNGSWAWMGLPIPEWQMSRMENPIPMHKI